MVDTTDLTAPLARLWRSVYRKAAEVAESRTLALVRDHVYRYHPNGAGGGGAVEDLYVDEVGDTMTGTLYMVGPDVDASGGVVISGPAVDAADGQLVGPESDAIGTITTSTNGTPGVVFTVSEATTLLAVSWLRHSTGTFPPPPEAVHLFDMSDGTLVWSEADLDAFAWDASPSLGWKTQPLAAADRPAPLVPFREYALCWQLSGFSYRTADVPYSPVPTGPIAFVANAFRFDSTVAPPDHTGSDFYLIDFAVGGDPVPSPPADAGAIRLFFGAEIAWRDEANTHNTTLSFDASDQLLVNGSPAALTAPLEARLAALEARLAALDGGPGPPPPGA